MTSGMTSEAGAERSKGSDPTAATAPAVTGQWSVQAMVSSVSVTPRMSTSPSSPPGRGTVRERPHADPDPVGAVEEESPRAGQGKGVDGRPRVEGETDRHPAQGGWAHGRPVLVAVMT